MEYDKIESSRALSNSLDAPFTCTRVRGLITACLQLLSYIKRQEIPFCLLPSFSFTHTPSSHLFSIDPRSTSPTFTMASVLGVLVGDIEVEERRPRTWNEPRRKRLSFVRDSRSRSRPSSSSSNDWAVVRHTGAGALTTTGHHRRSSDQEYWDERKLAVEDQFLRRNAVRLQQEQIQLQQRGQRLMMERDRLHMDRQLRMGHPPQQIDPRMQGHPDMHHHDPRFQQQRPTVPPQHHEHGRHDPRIQQIEPRHDNRRFDERSHFDMDDSDDEIIEIYDSDSHHGGRRSPKRISKIHDEDDHDLFRGRSHSREKKPKKSSLKKPKESKSKSKSKSKSVYSDSDSSSDDDLIFLKGYRAGARAVSKSRSWKERSRSRSRGYDRYRSDDEDSFDEGRYYDRPRYRSRSRGVRRGLWGM